MKNLSDSSFKGTLFTCDINHKLDIVLFGAPRHKILSSYVFPNSYYTLGFFYPNLWNERLSEIIEGLISGGIIKWKLEKWTKWKYKISSAPSENEKIVLNLSHLGFGFQICFFFNYVSFLVFLVELAIGRMQKIHDHNKKKKSIDFRCLAKYSRKSWKI